MDSKTKILQKLYLYRKNPELYKDIPNVELAELVMTVLSAVETIDKAVKEGRLDGFTPQPDKDYLSLATARKELTRELNNLLERSNKALSETATEMDKRVSEAISRLRDGKDGIVTEEELQRAAAIVLDNLELPDFDALIDERITANPIAVRDGLESIVEEDDKLEQSAIKNLPEDLRQLQEQIARINVKTQPGGGVSQARVLQLIAENGGSGGGVNVETPSGTANGSNTDFTVSNEPKYVIVNALTYFDGAGYSYSGGTITFDIPPVSGSTIKSIY